MMMYCKRSKLGLMASFVLAIAVSAPVGAQDDNRQAVVNLVVQVQQLQDEVRMLRGMLEEQAMELENLGNRQRDQYLDLDQRITGLRTTSPGPAVSTTSGTNSAVTYGASGTAVPETREDVPEIRPTLDTPSTVNAIALPDTQAREVLASPEAEKASYDLAFQSLKDLKYADAAEQFRAFLGQYPNSEYADNAQYWLGESYYVTRNYDIALEAFQGLLSDYPDSPKIADGLLKIGYTHYELKQWDQARAALTQVQEQYPDTTLARLAGSRLRSMKLEGHF
jgi:tol-pal system protein YbgF